MIARFSSKLVDEPSSMEANHVQLLRDPRVQIHTIAGSGFHMLGAGDSDSVVRVSSAVLSGIANEKFIHAKHTSLNEDAESIEEILCILKKHSLEFALELGQ
ncbi:MAG: hypothetical protein ACI87E_001355 [Mariniblastus sp.]